MEDSEMYGLFKITFEPHKNKQLLCVSKDSTNLVHTYTCLDRDETRGAKLVELAPYTEAGLKKLLGLTILRKPHYIIHSVDVV